MFENLTNKFEEVFSSKKAPSLDEKQVDEGLSYRQAFLEGDVSLDVAIH